MVVVTSRENPDVRVPGHGKAHWRMLNNVGVRQAADNGHVVFEISTGSDG